MSVLLQPEMEAVLEWVLVSALVSSGVCMASLAAMLIVRRLNVVRVRKASKADPPRQEGR
jgi:hypothetical protein